MITLRTIRGPRESRDQLLQFEPETTTWLVSDLKSKLDLNRSLLLERKFLRGEAVLRANELWRMLLGRVRPDLQSVSREFALTLIGERAASYQLEWAKAPGVAQAAFNYIGQLMPILAHPQGAEIMAEWFEKNPGSRDRWGRWYDLSVRLWKDFLEDGYIAPAWASGVLVNETGLHEVWKRPLVVDLGAELDQVEADLLLLLGDHVDITVLRPEPAWASEYSRCLVGYEILEKKLGAKKLASTVRESSHAPSQVTYRKYTTMFAEAKDAVAQARMWIDAGVEPRDIAIAAPDIELYWSVLESFFEQEGIPVQKDRVRRIHTFADVATWLAQLRLRTGAYDEADLELALFFPGKEGAKLISYDRFRTLYAMVYGREDLARAESISKRFAIQLQPGDSVTRDDFVAWSLKQLPEDCDFARIEQTFKRVFAECPPGVQWPVGRWIAYIEQIVSKTETRVADGDPDGVACIKLTSAENSRAARMVMMGLSEPALRQTVETALLGADLSSLAREYGFHLASDDQARLEFEARWVIEGGDREMVLTVPETDFNGSPLAPSWLWLKGARLAKQATSVTIPRATRWDEIQRAPLSIVAKERRWSATTHERIERSLKEDFNEAALEPFAIDLVKGLSPSRVEDYLKCPFIFAAKQLFRLVDDAELDLEIDASRRGSLMHKVFEMLTKEPMRENFALTDVELAAVVDAAREKAHIELADERMWPSLRAKHVDLARRFLKFEEDYRMKFGDSRVLAREFEIAGYLRPATGELVRDEEPGALKFVGRIDRVDEDSNGNVAIFDYKSSANSLTQYGSWLKNNRIQLLLYAIAIEKGLTSLEPREVLAALYYVARPFGRDTGFKVEGVEQGLYDIPDRRKKNFLSLEAKKKLFEEGQTLVRQAVEGLKGGAFAPSPRDKTTCNDCKWSPVCRTPHLNS
ncbi:MAG: PD-(D/E)XK nuclease family protein [Bdellovibrionota bacterium]